MLCASSSSALAHLAAAARTRQFSDCSEPFCRRRTEGVQERRVKLNLADHAHGGLREHGGREGREDGHEEGDERGRVGFGGREGRESGEDRRGESGCEARKCLRVKVGQPEERTDKLGALGRERHEEAAEDVERRARELDRESWRRGADLGKPGEDEVEVRRVACTMLSERSLERARGERETNQQR